MFQIRMDLLSVMMICSRPIWNNQSVYQRFIRIFWNLFMRNKSLYTHATPDVMTQTVFETKTCRFIWSKKQGALKVRFRKKSVPAEEHSMGRTDRKKERSRLEMVQAHVKGDTMSSLNRWMLSYRYLRTYAHGNSGSVFAVLYFDA